MGACAGYPPVDRVPVVPRGNADGAGEPLHCARIPGCARVGIGLTFRVVRAGSSPDQKAEQVRSRIERERDAAHEPGVYRAGQLARRAFGGQHG